MVLARRLPAMLLSSLGAAAALLFWFGGVQAAPVTTPATAATTRFAAANGSGGGCTQAAPCALKDGLAQSGNGDTLYVKQGTYLGSGAAVLTLTHSISLFGGWTGNPSGLPARSPLASPSTIDGQNSRRGIYVSSGLTPTIDGFVIRNGNASGLVNGCSLDSAAGCGGGMFVDHAAPRIEHNQFISNVAEITTTEFEQGHGGGLYIEWGNGAIISANVFLSNSAELPPAASSGGGLAATGYNNAGVVFQNNRFSGNSAYWGGGMSLDSDHSNQVQGNVFENNTAAIGAGFYAWTSSGAVVGNTFRGNSGDTPIFLGYFAGTLEANLVVDNATTSGLSLFNNYPSNSVVIYNNIIAHNGGAGIWARGYISLPLTIFVLNNTLVGSGSGTGLVAAAGYVTLTAHNNIVSGFNTGVSVSFPITSNVSLLYTLFDTDVAATGAASISNSVFGSPGFIDPVSRNYHIGFNSAARNAGGATLVGDDFDGDSRPLGAANDIGADETRFQDGLFLPLLRR
jgi:hypothetical protein